MTPETLAPGHGNVVIALGLVGLFVFAEASFLILRDYFIATYNK